jgi:hypothetical protein
MLSERRDPRPLAITAVLLATAVWLVTAWTAEARAAPPSNDARATAQDLGRLPADVRGTTVDAAVAPDEPGTVERFDPLAGWLFDAQFRPAVAGGRGTVAFHPRSVGRWRVTGSFEETRRASASAGGSARFRVAEPLTE